MYPGIADHPELIKTVNRQRGVVRRAQLREAGLSAGYVDAQIAARRWGVVGNNVVVLQNADLTRDQLVWAAVLDAAGLAALGSHTALELWGWRSFAREAADIHLIVARGARTTPLPGVRVHESRRIRPEQVVEVKHLPCTGAARSAIDAAAWQPYPRFACAVASAVVQQGLATPAELQNELRYVGRVRHKAYLRLALLDIAGGAQSVGELDLAQVCRRFGLVAPDRQVPRRANGGGWRFLDAEWLLPSGEIVVLEVDGGHHRLVEHWEADMRRERAIVVSRRRVLRATNFELRLDAAAIVADLRALGVPTLSELSDSRRALAS